MADLEGTRILGSIRSRSWLKVLTASMIHRFGALRRAGHDNDYCLAHMNADVWGVILSHVPCETIGRSYLLVCKTFRHYGQEFLSDLLVLRPKSTSTDRQNKIGFRKPTKCTTLTCSRCRLCQSTVSCLWIPTPGKSNLEKFVLQPVRIRQCTLQALILYFNNESGTKHQEFNRIVGAIGQCQRLRILDLDGRVSQFTDKRLSSKLHPIPSPLEVFRTTLPVVFTTSSQSNSGILKLIDIQLCCVNTREALKLCVGAKGLQILNLEDANGRDLRDTFAEHIQSSPSPVLTNLQYLTIRLKSSDLYSKERQFENALLLLPRLSCLRIHGLKNLEVCDFAIIAKHASLQGLSINAHHCSVEAMSDLFKIWQLEDLVIESLSIWPKDIPYWSGKGTNKAATLRPLGLKRLCVQSKQTDELDYLVPALKAPGLTALSLSCRSASGIIKHLPYFEKLAGQNCRIEILSALGFNSLEKISLQNVGLMVQNNTAERIQKGKLRNKSSTKLTCFEQSLQLMRGASDVEKRMIPKRYMQQAIQS